MLHRTPVNMHTVQFQPAVAAKRLPAEFALIFCLLCALALSPRVSATTLLGLDVDKLVSDAELIFEGRVIDRATRQDPNSGLINTYVTFQVVDVVKGDFNGTTLELKFTGGVINGQIVEVSGLVIPALDEEGIYFVESVNTDMLNPLLGWSQGHYLIVEEGGERRVSTVDNRPVTDVQPVSGIPQTIRKPQTLIEGNTDAAAGVMTEASSLEIERALTVDQFKSRIEALIEN